MPLVKEDCATQVEDLRLLYAKDYVDLVNGTDDQTAGPFPTSKGPVPNQPTPNSAYAAWPPGPQPTPKAWTDPKSGTTWTQDLIDGKWMFRSSKDSRLYITASNLYDLMGVQKNPVTGFAITPPMEEVVEEESMIAGIKTKWWVLGGLGALILLGGKGKR